MTKNTRSLWVPLFLATATVALTGAASWSCLVDSGCVSNTDCAFPEQCSLSTGDCYLECTPSSAESCPEDLSFCDSAEFRCVACLEDEDCPGENLCVNQVCVPSGAPTFALSDVNPESPTFGETFSLTEYRGRPVLLFFAGLG